MTGAPLMIRMAGADDITALLDLYLHLNPEDARPTPTQAAKILNQLGTYPGSGVLIGRDEGQAVASCTLIIIPNLTRGGAPYALIENVVTHTDARQKGFGKQILAAAAKAAWDAGCYKVMLMTGSENEKAIRFYLDAGFEQTKTGFQMRRIAPRPAF